MAANPPPTLQNLFRFVVRLREFILAILNYLVDSARAALGASRVTSFVMARELGEEAMDC